MLLFKAVNKFIYAHIGAGEVLKRLCDVPFPITLHCDGKEVMFWGNILFSAHTAWAVASQVDLGDMQGIIVLNIPSYGGGVDLWTGATATDSHELTAQVPVLHTHCCS